MSEIYFVVFFNSTNILYQISSPLARHHVLTPLCHFLDLSWDPFLQPIKSNHTTKCKACNGGHNPTLHFDPKLAELKQYENRQKKFFSMGNQFGCQTKVYVSKLAL